jgi:hypothetical protein
MAAQSAEGDVSMFRKILSCGSVAGLIAGPPLFGLTVAMKDHPPLPYGAAIG